MRIKVAQQSLMAGEARLITTYLCKEGILPAMRYKTSEPGTVLEMDVPSPCRC